MAMRLSDSQRAYLHGEPTPPGHFTKIRLALRLVDANLQDLAAATGIAAPQLSRYISGGDLMLSTAHRVAAVFGLTVGDLWPTPPTAKADRRKRSKTASAGKRIRAAKVKAPKAEAA